MRSSVSYLLSSATPEPNMSHPDYEQYSHDHGTLLVLVRHIGNQLKPKSYAKFFDRIGRVNSVKITDSTGQARTIFVRYVKDHPVENNDWGDFQTHRRLLGLISIGKYDSQQELNEICRVHESLKVKYTNTLFDSRCILLRPVSDIDSPIEGSDDGSSATTSGADESSKTSTPGTPIDSPSLQSMTSNASGGSATMTQVDHLANHMRHNSIHEKYTTPTNFRSRALFYTETDPCTDLESTLTEFVHSLFWVLESKRLERSREKLEKVQLLLAPFEKKDFVGLDMESRNNKKKCTGRMTKNLGDLCLQAGLLTESLNYYANAAEILRSVNDWLWLGAAFEGLSAASALVLYPHIQRTVPLHRNASLQETASNCHSLASSGPAASLSGQSSAAVGAGNNSPNRRPMELSVIELSAVRRDVTNTLPPDAISNRYRDAIVHYSKYQNAGIIETEASFKAARISIAQNHPLQAASFLQNVVFINLTLSEAEKIERFETLSDLYMQIGFVRKASFCQRLAATRYVSAQNPTPNWNQCYLLMLNSISGHRLCLDPAEMCANRDPATPDAVLRKMKTQNGWPSLQIQLLSELVVAAKRMGHSALATRHMTFLLQTMWEHLSPSDQKEFSLQLQSLSSQCEGAPVPLVLENGLVIPPANLTNIPVCTGFIIRQLPAHLRPKKIEIEKRDTGPFLFTPINFGSLDRRSNKCSSKMDFLWVENDRCEVTLKLLNPLPFELKVSNMRLLTQGVVFESSPESVILPTSSSVASESASSSVVSHVVTSVTLHGSPRESGDLDMLGYSTHTLGVKSNCRLRYFDKLQRKQYTVEVIPSLPTVLIKTSLPTQSHLGHSSLSMDHVVTTAMISLYNGQSSECTITFTNNSTIDIEMIDISMQSILDLQLQEQIFSWNNEELLEQLPLKPSESAILTLRLYSAANFLPNAVNYGTTTSMGAGVGSGGVHHDLLSSGVYGSSSQASSMIMSMGASATGAMGGPSSLPSRMHSPVPTIGRRNDVNASFRSSNSGHSGITAMGTSMGAGAGRSPAPIGSSMMSTHVVDGQLQVRYSGGPGFTAQYCRTCSIYITLEMLPSLQVTHWDVIPAEISSQFYLVLDVANLTSHEMELYYAPNKHMLIEAHESCRVPVPVDRCPLSKLTTTYTTVDEMSVASLSLGTSLTSSRLADETSTERICSEHIAGLACLRWRLTPAEEDSGSDVAGSSEVAGTATLKGITLSTSMLDVVRMSPLVWDVSFNGERVNPTRAINCDIAERMAIHVRVQNSLDKPLKELNMSMQFYQDYQNGTFNYKLESRLAITGPNKILWDILEPGACAEHTCNVIVFIPGQYKLDIQCCAPEPPGPPPPPLGGGIAGGHHQYFPSSAVSTASNAILQFQSGVPKRTLHVWKFIPPIEINVDAS